MHAEPAAVLPIPVQVQTKLGGLGVPGLLVVELDPFLQLEAPAVGFYLLPAFHRAQGNYLEFGGVDPGEGVNGQLLAGHVVDVAATELVVDVQRSGFVRSDYSDAIPGSSYLLRRLGGLGLGNRGGSCCFWGESRGRIGNGYSCRGLDGPLRARLGGGC